MKYNCARAFALFALFVMFSVFVIRTEVSDVRIPYSYVRKPISALAAAAFVPFYAYGVYKATDFGLSFIPGSCNQYTSVVRQGLSGCGALGMMYETATPCGQLLYTIFSGDYDRLQCQFNAIKSNRKTIEDVLEEILYARNTILVKIDEEQHNYSQSNTSLTDAVTLLNDPLFAYLEELVEEIDIFRGFNKIGGDQEADVDLSALKRQVSGKEYHRWLPQCILSLGRSVNKLFWNFNYSDKVLVVAGGKPLYKACSRAIHGFNNIMHQIGSPSIVKKETKKFLESAQLIINYSRDLLREYKWYMLVIDRMQAVLGCID